MPSTLAPSYFNLSVFIATTDCVKPMHCHRCRVTDFDASSLKGHCKRKEDALSILWIILIVVLVLALLGFFARGV